MHAVAQFREMAREARFRGWPLVGDYRLGETVPFFGQLLHYQLNTGNGIEEYTSILRHFGWVVVFGVTTDGVGEPCVITLVQWKPGVNRASWELPPGGIGRTPSGISSDVLLTRTQTAYLQETGYGYGEWHYLGSADVESGKYRGASPEDHGLPAHMYLATDLRRIKDTRNPNPNEIMSTLLVPLREFDAVIDSGEFREVSALTCALLALRRPNLLSAT